jgi:MYXO-CTERM domain-containing protein
MTTTLLAHAEHVAPHVGTETFIGVALLLMGAGAALWRTRRRDSPRRRQSRQPSRSAGHRVE